MRTRARGALMLARAVLSFARAALSCSHARCSNRAAADDDVFVEGDVSIVTVTKSRSYSSTADASAADPVKVLC